MGRNASAILRPPPPASPFETSGSFLGSFGDPSDPIVVSAADGHLFRDDNEFYPIAGARYYIPASGALMSFRRTATETVDALITVRVGGRESLALRIAPRP